MTAIAPRLCIFIYNLSGSKNMARAKISFPPDAISQFCRQHHIRKLSVFGSAVREDFNPESDVDVLVEFETGHVPGLSFFAMEAELGRLLGRRVELHTPRFLSREIREQALAEAEVQYVAP